MTAMNKPLYYIMYDFIPNDLGLSGYAKDIFAVIFGFWRKMRAPVQVSLTTFQQMTGASRPSVVSTILLLEKIKLISVTRDAGKTTRYNILLSKDKINVYEKRYSHLEKTFDAALVKPVYRHRSVELTASGKATKPENKIQRNKENNFIEIGSIPEIK